MRTVLCWFRRDLRLGDNRALASALQEAEQVVPVVVLDPAQLASTYSGEKSLSFFYAGLRALDADLRRRGSYLVVRRGNPAQVLAGLLHEVAAEVIYAQEDVSPFARRRDEAVAARLPLRLVGGITVHRSADVVKADGSPYTIFAQFERAWHKLPLPGLDAVPSPPARVPSPPGLTSEPIPGEPALSRATSFLPSEEVASRRLEDFTVGADAPIYRYVAERDRLDIAGTSRLSPYLRFGMLSPRQAVAAARRAYARARDESARAGAAAWLRQLVWREFYLALLYHRPRVLHEAQQERLRDIEWENDEDAFAAWKEGRTGYPLVDAAMRQLAAEGWLPNRARLTVGSFLVKDLLVNWQWGERWFMEQLVDGDPAVNNGNWQWVAGVGTDSMHYFRIFNPVLQSKKYDPQGAYIRHWLPELGKVPDRYVHEPWRMSLAEQRASRCVIGGDYPAPIVDHASARERALAAYRRALGKA